MTHVTATLLASSLDELLRLLKPLIEVVLFAGGAIAVALAKRKSVERAERGDTKPTPTTSASPPARERQDGWTEPVTQTDLEDRVRKFMNEVKRGPGTADAAPRNAPKQSVQSKAPAAPSVRQTLARGPARGPTLAPPQPPSIHTSITTSLEKQSPGMAVSRAGGRPGDIGSAAATERPQVARSIASMRRRPKLAKLNRNDWRRAMILREVLGPPKGLES